MRDHYHGVKHLDSIVTPQPDPEHRDAAARTVTGIETLQPGPKQRENPRESRASGRCNPVLGIETLQTDSVHMEAAPRY